MEQSAQRFPLSIEYGMVVAFGLMGVFVAGSG